MGLLAVWYFSLNRLSTCSSALSISPVRRDSSSVLPLIRRAVSAKLCFSRSAGVDVLMVFFSPIGSDLDASISIVGAALWGDATQPSAFRRVGARRRLELGQVLVKGLVQRGKHGGQFRLQRPRSRNW